MKCIQPKKLKLCERTVFADQDLIKLWFPGERLATKGWVLNKIREKYHKYWNNKRSLVFTKTTCGKEWQFFLFVVEDQLYLFVKIYWIWYCNAYLIREMGIVAQMSDVAPGPLVLFVLNIKLAYFGKILKNMSKTLYFCG